jgi:hypothetical protein
MIKIAEPWLPGLSPYDAYSGITRCNFNCKNPGYNYVASIYNEGKDLWYSVVWDWDESEYLDPQTKSFNTKEEAIKNADAELVSMGWKLLSQDLLILL